MENFSSTSAVDNVRYDCLNAMKWMIMTVLTEKYLGQPWPPSSAGIIAVSMNFEVAGTDSTLTLQ